MTQSEAILAAARKYIGAPWRHQGRSSWLDCVGLALAAAEDLHLLDREGLPIRRCDYANYPAQPRSDFLERECARRLCAESLDALAPAMLAVMRAPLSHAGIIGEVRGNGHEAYLTLIHAHAFRKIAEHRLDDLWRLRIVACFSFPEIAN